MRLKTTDTNAGGSSAIGCSATCRCDVSAAGRRKHLEKKKKDREEARGDQWRLSQGTPQLQDRGLTGNTRRIKGCLCNSILHPRSSVGNQPVDLETSRSRIQTLRSSTARRGQTASSTLVDLSIWSPVCQTDAAQKHLEPGWSSPWGHVDVSVSLDAASISPDEK